MIQLTPHRLKTQKKVGSDYSVSSLCYWAPNSPNCQKQVLEIPYEPQSTRRDPICAGNSRHGAPCTTGRRNKYAGRCCAGVCVKIRTWIRRGCTMPMKDKRWQPTD